jgi:uncharacterized membrane protein
MSFANPIPLWAILLVLAGAAFAAWRMYQRPLVPLSSRRRAALMALRFATLVALIVFFMRPVRLLPAAGARDAVVAVLVDTSRSMAIADAGGRARIDRAAEIVTSTLLPALAPAFRVEVLGFGEALQPADPARLTPSARRSDLSGALRAARERYQGRSLSALVVVSDGGETAGAAPSPEAAEGLPPVYAVGVGSPGLGRDRELTSVTAGEAALAGSVIEVSASVVARGFGADPIELRVLENGRPIEVRRVTPSADGAPVLAVFQVSPQRDSATLYTVEIPRDPSELVAENNARSVLVPPPGRRRRLLLVEGAPGFEHSFLQRAWTGDPGFEVDSVVRKGQNERGRDTYYVRAAATRAAALADGYPATREALFAYDAIVLANVPGDFLSRAQLALTEQFVGERGGGLLILGGRSFADRGLAGTPLEDVVPVDLAARGGIAVPASWADAGEPHRLTLTADGEAHPIMRLARSADDSRKRWAEAPPLASSAPVGGPRPGASVLATATSPGGARPIVAVQRYGEGRAMIFGGEASWRWKMGLPAADSLYDTFWRQAARWLSTAAPAPIAIAAPPDLTPGQEADIAVLVRDAAFAPVRDASVTIRVAAPGGGVRELRASLTDAAAGRYTAGFSPAQAGVHRIQAEVRRGSAPAGSAETFALAGGADPEMADPRLNEAVLRRVAQATGGRLLDDAEVADLGAIVRDQIAAPAQPIARDLWHTRWALLAVVLLLSAEWSLRRAWGLR